MSPVAEAERLLFSLSEKDRNELIGKVLRSLPLYSDDGGISEAIRRSEEMETNPELGMTAEHLNEKLVERFPFLSHRSSE